MSGELEKVLKLLDAGKEIAGNEVVEDAKNFLVQIWQATELEKRMQSPNIGGLYV